MALTGPEYLVDKSALARLANGAVDAVLSPLLADGKVATSGILLLEVLYSARSHTDFVRTRLRLEGLPFVEVLPRDFTRALDVMEQLARRGQHRAAGLPDLLQAAVAERHGLTLLHYDADYDVVAGITGQRARWVVPQGSVS